LWDGDRAPLNELDLDTVCRALYQGYEIEMDPEEKVLEYYLKNYHAAPVIEEVLNILNVQIKGVNC
jgi:hypothetical protein